MQHGAVAELLAGTPMLSGLGSELLAAIILRGDTVRFSAGEPVTLAGTPADSALYILEGKVALPEQGSQESTPSLEPGSALTEMAMFVETDHYHNAIALDDVVVLQISRELMGHLVFERPVLADCFATNIRNNLASIAQHLNEINAMIESSAFPELENEPEPEPEPEQEVVSQENTQFRVDELESTPPQTVFSQGTDAPHSIQIHELAPEGFSDTGAVETPLTGSQFETLIIGDNESSPVRDIMAELSQFSFQPDQTQLEQGHGQTVSPNLAPHQSHEEIGLSFSEQASPIYGLAGGPGSSGASQATGNSTR